MRSQSRTVPRRVERIAATQHGNVSRAQLLRAGLTHAGIQRRVAAGVLWPTYRGVYRLGHRAPSLDADYMGATLACGEGALLCGVAAAYVHRLVKRPPARPEVVARTERRIAGIDTRRCRGLDNIPRARVRGIPLTTVPQTLMNLAAVLPEDDLARACHEAGVLYRTTPAMVEAVLASRPNVPGAPTLRAVMRGEIRVKLSELESEFLERLVEDGLPLPETNRVAGGRRVDCRWPEQRLTVELDSYRFHSSRHAWEEDRRREREARARGDEFRRYTWHDVVEDPEPMLRELRALLTRRPA
jgi:very-short-patch-repair endonuclease